MVQRRHHDAAGAVPGGVLVMRFGTRILFLGAVLTASTNPLPAPTSGHKPGAAEEWNGMD